MKLFNMKNLALAAGTLLVSSSLLAYTGGGGSTPPPPPPPTDGDYTRGDTPTFRQLEGNGPYSVRSYSVSSWAASGFGGGTVHYPTNAGSGRMGGIAVIPGYLSYENSIKWWGPRLASWGFVVITTDTNSIYDQPDSRANQLSAALDYLINQSNGNTAISGMVDSNRLGVIGWSMGGGGALKVSTQRNIAASIPQAPYYSGYNNFNQISTPTMIIACENDTVAPVSSHAQPFYGRLSESSTPKGFIEINNGDHYCANSNNGNEDILGRSGVAWMKRYIDKDTRYNQFICGPDFVGEYDISRYWSNCLL